MSIRLRVNDAEFDAPDRRGRVDPHQLELGPIEQWVQNRASHGLYRFALIGATPIILISMFLSSVSLAAGQGLSDRRTWIITLVTAAVIPGLLATPVIAYFGRLVNLLTEASRVLRHAANTDSLTQINNRRGFFGAIEELTSETDVDEVLVLDLNAFKSLNDVHGHDFGDRALVLIAGWLRDLVQDCGFAGRLGGDEFACVFTSASGFVPTSKNFQLAGVDFSIAIGRSVLDPGMSVEEALLQADADLYRNKRAQKASARDEAIHPSISQSDLAGLPATVT